MSDWSSSASSPLSVQSSNAFDGEDDHMSLETTMPPAKRQRLGDSSRETVAYSVTPPKLHEDASISSDSEGEVPNSPGTARPDDDDTHEQVTRCLWTGCDAGDLGNMDELVKHIHREHVETKAKKYTCEWSECSRRSTTHASAYALRAHMRSHTKEKPFFCELPECDRAFTRSDALQKHYRTVHETEALRPSDPIPKSMQAKHVHLSSSGITGMKEEHTVYGGQALSTPSGASMLKDQLNWSSSFPPDLGVTEDEEAMGSQQFYRLLRREIHWAEEESMGLKQSYETLDKLRKSEWIDNQILLDQVLTIEHDFHERRKLVLAGSVDIPVAGVKIAPDRSWNANHVTESPYTIGTPSPMSAFAKGQVVEDQREAAAVLASLAQDMGMSSERARVAVEPDEEERFAD